MYQYPKPFVLVAQLPSQRGGALRASGDPLGEAMSIDVPAEVVILFSEKGFAGTSWVRSGLSLV